MTMGEFFSRSERSLQQEVAISLSSLGLKVQTDVPFKEAGIRLDVLAETPNGERILVEVKSSKYSVAYLVKYASGALEHNRTITNSVRAFVVVKWPDEQPSPVPNIVDIKGLVRAVETMLAGESAPSTVAVPQTEEVITTEVVPTLFVAMPFADQFYDTFEVGIVGAARETGFVCDRMDREIFGSLIAQEMHRRIHRCAGFVADVTGANPNVMYELGYAHASRKPTVMLSATAPDQLPFDIRGWPLVLYRLGQTRRLQEQLIPWFQRITNDSSFGSGW